MIYVFSAEEISVGDNEYSVNVLFFTKLLGIYKRVNIPLTAFKKTPTPVEYNP